MRTSPCHAPRPRRSRSSTSPRWSTWPSSSSSSSWSPRPPCCTRRSRSPSRRPSPPPPPSPRAAIASLDDLKDDYILVEIDDRGAMKLDREPIEPVMATLVEQLRTAREKTGRKSMLLSADFTTPHRNAVLAYDAANEIGLGIAIAKPQRAARSRPDLQGRPARPQGRWGTGPRPVMTEMFPSRAPFPSSALRAPSPPGVKAG